jgi:hypothetical protein
MRKRFLDNHRLLILGLVLAGTLALTGPAHAVWYTVHGQSGHIQDPSLVSNISPFVYYGWGIDITEKAPSSNWVHFSVPTNVAPTQGVQNVRVTFKTYIPDAWISQVDVYDGNVKIKSFFGHWTGVKTLYLKLDSITTITQGLGISVKILAGVDSGDHRIVIYGVAANVVDKP